MHKELELWKFVAGRLKRGEPLMLLVVAESTGSSPGRPGFKMAVAEGGELRGSIGGGVMEINLVEQAKMFLNAETQRRRDENEHEITVQKSQIPNPKSQILPQVHRRNSSHASGMICSGRQTVVFYRLGAEDLPDVRRIVRALGRDQSDVLQISNSSFQVLENASGDLDFRFSQTGDKEFLYEEKLGFKNRLFIIGGGHCALALSELMSKMDFRITLLDDRAALNTLEKNRFVHEKKIIESYEKIGDYVESGNNVYVVVMTLGYRFDEIVIRKLLDRDFRYFGVLGSRAKMAALLRDLRDEGFEADRLNRVRTPVGIRINSRTPEEIAVSIAAEIIAVKNAKG